MSFLAMLIGFFVLLHLPGVGRWRPVQDRQAKGAFALAFSFLVTGSLHFTGPARFLAMMPPWLPWQLGLVYVSGFLELLGAAGLMLRRTRRIAGISLALLLLAIFPANIYVAVSGGSVDGLPEGAWYYWLRLPLQFVFITWALRCSQLRPTKSPAAESAAPG